MQKQQIVTKLQEIEMNVHKEINSKYDTRRNDKLLGIAIEINKLKREIVKSVNM